MGVLNGLLLLARFRVEGFAGFTASVQGFVNSLTPLVALAIVAGLRPLLSGSLRQLALHLFTTAIALLAPAAISHLLARLWHRESSWLRYIVAYNWCHASVTLLTIPAILGAMAGGTPGIRDIMLIGAAGILLYWLAVAWFLFRRGLGISGGSAALAVLATHIGTGLLLFGPAFIAAGMQ